MFRKSFVEVTPYSVVGPNRNPGSWRRSMDLSCSGKGEMGIRDGLCLTRLGLDPLYDQCNQCALPAEYVTRLCLSWNYPAVFEYDCMRGTDGAIPLQEFPNKASLFTLDI